MQGRANEYWQLRGFHWKRIVGRLRYENSIHPNIYRRDEENPDYECVEDHERAGVPDVDAYINDAEKRKQF